MKKLITSLVFAALAMPVFAQLGDFTFDGFVRTGFIWQKSEEIGKDPKTEVRLGNLDDSGGGQGRIRMNFSYVINNVGFKGRLQWDNWQNSQKAPEWPYLFAYINSFEDQLTISAGKLGSSPWGTGGPEKWKKLESMSDGSGGGGVRFEYKPLFAPGLNAGIVLNWYDGSLDRGIGRDVTLLDVLQETVFGVAYDHEYFLVHFEYRLDSEIDQRPGSANQSGGVKEGDDIIYRLEEHIIKNYLPGFSVWALGEFQGIGAVKDYLYLDNWLFTQYQQDWGTAQIRFGYKVTKTRSSFHLKPSYYHNFFDKLLTVGASFKYENDFGEGRINKDAPYTELEFEPKLQINFSNAYVAFTYNFKQTYKQPQKDIPKPIERFQNMNLRFGLWF